MRVRLLGAPGACDAAAVVELELDLGRLDAESASREAPLAQVGRNRLRAFQRPGEVGLRAFAAGEDGLGSSVGEPLAAADDGAVEVGLAARERDLHRDAEAILVRS